jgi:membrane-associated phospholipid phosphatase
MFPIEDLLVDLAADRRPGAYCDPGETPRRVWRLRLSWGVLTALVSQLAEWEGVAMQAAADIRWEPLTILFALASAWWVKWPLFAAVGACGDLQCRRRVPFVALTALGAAAAAGLVVSLLKGISDRARPPIADPALHAIGVVPDSTSFPSGHSATAFATAIVVGFAYPRLRLPLLALAALVALSRVYLGMHYWSDVLAGSLLGAAIGLAMVWLIRRAQRAPTAPAPNLAPPGTS